MVNSLRPKLLSLWQNQINVEFSFDIKGIFHLELVPIGPESEWAILLGSSEAVLMINLMKTSGNVG